MGVFSSRINKTIDQRNFETKHAQVNKNLITTLFITFLTMLVTISLEINGHSLSFYRWDWIQIPFVLHVFFTSLAILSIICKSKPFVQSKKDVIVPQFLPSIPVLTASNCNFFEIFSKPVSQIQIEQDLNAYGSTLAKVTTEFMGPLIVKRLDRSSRTYITQIKNFTIAQAERSSPYLVSFEPTSSMPFREKGIVFDEREWHESSNNRNRGISADLPLHRQYTYRILQNSISVFASLREYDLNNISIKMDDNLYNDTNPLTTITLAGRAFINHCFTPPKLCTLIDAATRGVKAIQIRRTDSHIFSRIRYTEIDALGKSEELEETREGHLFPVRSLPPENLQAQLIHFVVQYYDFNPWYIFCVPHLSIIACFNLVPNSIPNEINEFYITKSNERFERKLVNFRSESYYALSSSHAVHCDTQVHIQHDGHGAIHEVTIDGYQTTQIINNQIVALAFLDLEQRIETLITTFPRTLPNLIVQYLNPNHATRSF